MKIPSFRITCCKCGKPIPKSQDHYVLDAEWQRRFPAMIGTIACQTCALRTSWSCDPKDRSYNGHIPIKDRSGREPSWCDSWSHIAGQGTQAGIVLGNPAAALRQGAEAYLRWWEAAPQTDTHARQELRIVLHDWDGLDPAQFEDQLGATGPAPTPAKPAKASSDGRWPFAVYGQGQWQVPGTSLTYTPGEGIYDKAGYQLSDCAPVVSQRFLHRLADGRAHCEYVTITVGDRPEDTRTIPRHEARRKSTWLGVFLVPGAGTDRVRKALAAIVEEQAGQLPETTVLNEDEIPTRQRCRSDLDDLTNTNPE